MKGEAERPPDLAYAFWLGELRTLASNVGAQCQWDPGDMLARLQRALGSARGGERIFARWLPPTHLTEAQVECGLREAIRTVTEPVIGKRASEIEARPVNWLWPGRIARGNLTVLEGDPGCGKSTLMCDLAARVSSGREWPDGLSGEPGTVIIISAEDDPASTIRPRLEAAKADLDRVIIARATLDSDDGPRLLTLPDDLPLIEDDLIRTGARLAVLDPLNAFLSGKVDSHRDQDVRRVLAAIAGMAERTQAAVAVIRHLNKGGGSNPMYRGGGSIGISGAARAVFLVGIDPDDDESENCRILAPIKCNLAKEPTALAFRLVQAEGDSVAHVEWIAGAADVSARDLLRERETNGSGSIGSAVAFLTEFLAERPRPTTEVVKAATTQGISTRTLDRARKAMGVRPLKPKGSLDGPWYMALPNGPSQRENGEIDCEPKPAESVELRQDGNIWQRSS